MGNPSSGGVSLPIGLRVARHVEVALVPTRYNTPSPPRNQPEKGGVGMPVAGPPSPVRVRRGRPQLRQGENRACPSRTTAVAPSGRREIESVDRPGALVQPRGRAAARVLQSPGRARRVRPPRPPEQVGEAHRPRPSDCAALERQTVRADGRRGSDSTRSGPRRCPRRVTSQRA
jgi:hypothetical protein